MNYQKLHSGEGPPLGFLTLILFFTFSTLFSQTMNPIGQQSNMLFDTIQSDVPSLLYATYWGGSDDDEPENMIIDHQGNIIIAGQTKSTDLPVTDDAFQGHNAGLRDIFVAKFAHDYSLIWATYIGGTGADYAYGLAVDSQGAIYVGGTSGSTDFPVLNAFQATSAGDDDGVLIKFDGNGNRLWSTYFGGTDGDDINGVAVDEEGRLYITGETRSHDLYVTPGAFQETNTGDNLCFVTRFTPEGHVVWSTYFGGNDEENGNDVIVDQNQDIIIIGEAYSLDCPLTPGFYQDSVAGSDDALLMKMDSIGNLIFATVLGGTDDDDGRKVGVDAENNVYIIGDLISTDFPTTEGAFQSTLGGEHDAFITKFDNAGQLVWSTYLGGVSFEFVYGIDVDSTGTVYVYGETESPDFPVTEEALQPEMGAPDDMFITTLDSVGNIIWSTFWGGNGDEDAAELRFHKHKMYIVGTAESTDIPITDDAWQPDYSGEEDGYFAIFKYDVFYTGISDHTLDEVIVYPQPATDILTLQFGDKSLDEEIHIQLSDNTGRVALLSTIPRATKSFTLDISRLPAGMYFISLKNGEKFLGSKKVLIQ